MGSCGGEARANLDRTAKANVCSPVQSHTYLTLFDTVICSCLSSCHRRYFLTASDFQWMAITVPSVVGGKSTLKLQLDASICVCMLQ